MAWLTKKAFGMRRANHRGRPVFSISQKCVDQPCVTLPFSSSGGSVFICVCIQRSGMPLKWSWKVIDFTGVSLKGEVGDLASEHLKSHDYASATCMAEPRERRIPSGDVISSDCSSNWHVRTKKGLLTLTRCSWWVECNPIALRSFIRSFIYIKI